MLDYNSMNIKSKDNIKEKTLRCLHKRQSCDTIRYGEFETFLT